MSPMLHRGISVTEYNASDPINRAAGQVIKSMVQFYSLNDPCRFPLLAAHVKVNLRLVLALVEITP